MSTFRKTYRELTLAEIEHIDRGERRRLRHIALAMTNLEGMTFEPSTIKKFISHPLA
jgi:hypothetical protein